MRMGGVNQSLKAIYYPVGCVQCLNTGYLGRRGLFELLTMSDPLRDVVLKNPTMGAIHEALARDVFVSLQDMGHQVVAAGETSIEEVDRVVGST
jgi:general secretion pathway protein E